MTVRSPCISTISGFACSSSITSVLIDAMFVDAELARRFLGAAMLDILVRMLAERRRLLRRRNCVAGVSDTCFALDMCAL